ncbi:MAG: hypothetical protein GX631_05755 [Dehalococcoidales bacterium]|nr:hypothetical protein [Dehalococcoidales bacterium]
MSRWKLRACPRCKGDIYVERDNEEVYERCLQCGHSRQIAGAYFGKENKREETLQKREKVLSGIH